jgi:hypothetical protein
VKWSTLAIPKYLGGWGLKNIFLFAKALVAKSVWRLISTDNLWTQVVTHKYILAFLTSRMDKEPFKEAPCGFNYMESIGVLL